MDMMREAIEQRASETLAAERWSIPQREDST
jgi:hypothetical protein